ncbi:hypothetical protein [Amycolatopsis dendrobii]|uniref:Oxidoreductase n=1 Tax=Amycolatopsis dendrobii TaxID=2760662 RepID=A0A7W3VYF6_9PSEU|nr:hypothetical protein [Amycolatopsis dendrobii]MBB1155455.1 hypothetical protein [Amycolatopsis dendrobii]
MTAPRTTDLSDFERRLVESAREGELLGADQIDVDDLAETESPAHLVRAAVLRDLLLGRHGDLDPRGIMLARARITGELNLDGVSATAGLMLLTCVFDQPVLARQARLPHLYLIGGRMPGLHASRVRIEGDLHLSDGVRITGDSPDGAIRLIGAHLGGSLLCRDADIVNPAGLALEASSAELGSGLYLHRGTRITGSSADGAIHLNGASVGGPLECQSIKVSNDLGPAIEADTLTVARSMLIRDSELSGKGEIGAVRLQGAQIGGQLEFSATTRITSPEGRLLGLSDAKATTVFMPGDLVCPEGSTSAECDHSELAWLDGFTCTAIDPAFGWRRWLHLLRCHTEYYDATGYQKLAAVERTAGHDGNARTILIAQQDDLRRRSPEALGGRMSRLFHWIWGTLAGYGYRARRTAAALLLALVAAGVLGLCAGATETQPGHHAAQRVATGTACSPVELIGLGLDRGLPIAPTGLRSRCDLDTASVSGQVFTAAIWGVQVAVWGLATLALAGYTNLVRKTA